MAKNIKLTCNLTGDFRYVTEALYNKLCSQYGDEEKLLKFYVKKEISLLIKRGSRIMDIAVLHGFEYERDKEGNVISGYPDKNNHTIDADRYALESHYNKRGNSA